MDAKKIINYIKKIYKNIPTKSKQFYLKKVFQLHLKCVLSEIWLCSNYKWRMIY